MSSLSAQAQVVLYSLTESDGLTDNSINCFYQDHRGIMWMGTNFGLNALDGSVIQNWHHQPGANSLPHEAINAIGEDGKQQLWLATGNGLCLYNENDNRFTTWKADPQQEIRNRFYSMVIADETIWLATEEGLTRFDVGQKKFSQFKNPSTAPGVNRIVKLLLDSKHRLWLCTYHGLWQFDRQTQNFLPFDEPGNDPQFVGLITDVFEDHAGQIWFGTWSTGLKKLDPARRKVTGLLSYQNSSTNLVSIAEQKGTDGHYHLWTSTGLASPDTLTQTFKSLLINSPDEPALSNTGTLYCDRNNLLWISTTDGVKIYNPAKQFFTTKILSAQMPLTSQGVCVLPLKNRFLLGGEAGTALQLFSDSLQLIRNLSPQIKPGPAVMNIQASRNGNGYWLSTSGGLILLDSSLRKQKHFTSKNDNLSLPKNFLNPVLQRKDGSIWVMPWRKGAWELNPVTETFHRVLTAHGDSLLPHANISKAVEDSRGTVWLTDYEGGLFRFSPTNPAPENIITNRRLSNLFLLGDQLWTVSSAEVFQIDTRTGKTDTFLLPAGKNKYEYDFIPDQQGHLWIATKTGLLFFDIKTKNFRSFTESDGLYKNLLDISFAQLSNGQILMAGNTYITAFSPAIATGSQRSASLLFRSACSGQICKQQGNGVLHFNWDEKNISLSWALLQYNNPLQNDYYYKLDGVNKDWEYAGHKGYIVFSSMEPGRYTFHFKAAASDGVMSEEQTLILIIHPPFWKTTWFRLLAAVLLVFLFYRVIRYISQRNLKEKILKLEKEQALEKERNRISRDMHDELGSGLTKIAILTEVIKTRQPSNEHIEKISDTARNLVDNLDEMVWALNPKNDTLDKLAGYIAAHAHQFLENTGVECTISFPPVITPLLVQEEKRRNIFMVVKEFLNNTVKHAGAMRVQITLNETGNHFEIILTDNGKGFDLQEKQEAGNGLQNMQRRITDAGGQVSLESSPAGTRLSMQFDARLN